MTDFPHFQDDYTRETSSATVEYNCIAWAACDTSRWWWPTPGVYYWPVHAPAEETVEAFVVAFALFGFSECADASLEPGIEKVALYTTPAGTPTHMARQLPSGHWTSKLGSNIDIEHATLEQLEGPRYGIVARYLKRAV